MQLARHPFGVYLLLEDRRVRRAAANGEVVTADDDGTALDAGATHHEVRGREAGQLTLVVLGSSRERADFVEAAGVDQRVDALADGELASVVLTGDLLLATHRGRQLGAPPQLVELGIPGHLAIVRAPYSCGA